MQQVPSGMPDFVKPDFGTADLDRLKRDIPKWCKWMNPASCTKWTEFFETGITQLSGLPLRRHQWPLDLLSSLPQVQDDNLHPSPRLLLTRQNQECLVS